MSKPTFRYFLLILITFLILQASRLVFCSFLSCNLNQKIIFGLTGNNSFGIALMVAVYALVLLYVVKNPTKVGFVFCGAVLSNIYERLIFGGIHDYFSLPFIPLFNPADFIILFCLVYFAYGLIRKTKNP